MVRVAAAPCSPFSVSPRLMRETADLARGLGVRMHTHLAETREEVAYCRQALGCTPAEYAEDLGWLGPDVWLAHCVHLDEAAVRRFAATGTSAAHCPTSNARLGAGIAPVRDLLRAGVTVGLGVDGAASSEGTSLAGELRQALLAARVRDGNGPSALVLGPPAPLELLLVGGTPVVDGGELRTVDATTAAREVRAARQRLADPG
jgi:cytosine/adenosine deaminase-related metal-dependent hydrolase